MNEASVVVPIRGGNFVSELREWLTRAERGELSAVVLVAQFANKDHAMGWLVAVDGTEHDRVDRLAIIGGLERVKLHLLLEVSIHATTT